MKAIKVKIWMLKRGLTVAEIARQIAADPDKQTTANETTLRVTITDMINQRRYSPTIAAELERKFKLKLVRPPHLQPLPTRQAA